MPIPVSRDVGKTIRFLKREKPGQSRKQRVAIALSTARRAGARRLVGRGVLTEQDVARIRKTKITPFRKRPRFSRQLEAIRERIKKRKGRAGAVLRKKAKEIRVRGEIRRQVAKPVRVSARDVARELPSAAKKVLLGATGVGVARKAGRKVGRKARKLFLKHGFVPKKKKK